MTKTLTKAFGITDGRYPTACESCSNRRRSSRTRSSSARSAPAGRLAERPGLRRRRNRQRVVANGGLGTLTAVDLEQEAGGKTAVVRPDIEEMYEGLSGRALRSDLETMFQLIYLTFTQPRADAEAFQRG